MFANLLHDFDDRPFELGIAPFDHRLGIVFKFDVGFDAVTLDDPVPLGGSKAVLGNIHHAAVDQRAAVGNADDTAPRSFADQGAEPGLLEHRGEDVAIGSGVLVEHTDQVSVKHRGGVG